MQQASAVTGISMATLSRLERGLQRIGGDHVAALVDRLGVPVDVIAAEQQTTTASEVSGHS
jgi:transcriptional regulator with XRE-family HTH domain